jgi:RHS repeat-associated protein
MRSRISIGLCLLVGWVLPFSVPEELHAQTTVTYIHTDALGSPVAETDASGRLIEREIYEPYGLQITHAPSDGPGFTGHVADSLTGLVYMQQRYYDPEIGRFLSVDPLGANWESIFSFGRYNYANNNPILNIDPDGQVAYQVGNTVILPIYYNGSGATQAFIDNQVRLASHLIAEDGRTKIEIIPLSHALDGGNTMDVSPGGNAKAPVGGEGILSGSGGSAAHINSERKDAAGATLHDSLHFIPELGDGRKSDGYRERIDSHGRRIFEGLKPGFTHDNIMADTKGTTLGKRETEWIGNPLNGNGGKEELDNLIKRDRGL